MKWIPVEERLPKIGPDGYSEFVLVSPGMRCLPEVAQLSADNWTHLKGVGSLRKARTLWHSNVWTGDAGDRNGPMLEPRFWCPITFPE